MQVCKLCVINFAALVNLPGMRLAYFSRIIKILTHINSPFHIPGFTHFMEIEFFYCFLKNSLLVFKALVVVGRATQKSKWIQTDVQVNLQPPPRSTFNEQRAYPAPPRPAPYDGFSF